MYVYKEIKIAWALFKRIKQKEFQFLLFLNYEMIQFGAGLDLGFGGEVFEIGLV